MGIVVDVTSRTFSIEETKLAEISRQCAAAFICTRLSKRDLQSLLGKLLYISRCVTKYRQPTPEALFSLPQIREIARLCEIFENTLTYRVAFLVAFYGMLRISNIAPPFSKAFDPKKHLLCRDIQFKHPGIHLHLKWAKNIQAPEKTHTCCPGSGSMPSSHPPGSHQ